MPDLEKLYEKYKSQGLLIVGVTSSSTASSAKTVVEQTGVKYPVIFSTYEFNQFNTGYVPTTVFMDSDGNLLTSEPIIGSQSYSAWESVIKGYLN